MPLGVAYSNACKFFVSNEWPSNINITGWSLLGLECFLKCLRHLLNSSPSIHPIFWKNPNEPARPQSVKSGFMVSRENIKNGETKFPTALIAHKTVMILPLSHLVSAPGCIFFSYLALWKMISEQFEAQFNRNCTREIHQNDAPQLFQQCSRLTEPYCSGQRSEFRCFSRKLIAFNFVLEKRRAIFCVPYPQKD